MVALILLPFPAGAEHPRLTRPAVAPTAAELVPWQAPASLAADPATVVQDEAQLVRQLLAHPDRLNAEAMGNPELVRASVEVLLRADRVFPAERLLAQAVVRWPQDVELLRAWARVLLTLGRPQVARTQLEGVIAARPQDAAAHYLLARAWLAHEPRTAESDARAAEFLRRVVELDPAYRDSDGVNAEAIRELLQRMAGGRNPQ